MRCFSLIVSFALIFAAVKCEETEKVEEDVPEVKEVCEFNFNFFNPFQSIFIVVN